MTECDDGRIVSTFENFIPTNPTPPDILLPSVTSNNGNITNSNSFVKKTNNNFINENVKIGGDGSPNTQSMGSRRPGNTSIPTMQPHISKINSTKLLSLTINKDSNGYGMKVCKYIAINYAILTSFYSIAFSNIHLPTIF